MSRAAIVSGLCGALIVAGPTVAEACAVCTASANDGARQAFIWTTAFLTVLPLGILGGGLWWLWRRIQAHDSAPAPCPER